MKMEIFLILTVLAFCGWLYYRLQKKIGEEQAAEWEEFKKEHPEYFEKRKQTPFVCCGWTEQKIKEFLEGTWVRYNARHQQYTDNNTKV